METQSRRQVTKAAGIVMSAILISRILGFIRERAVAEVFGRTGITDVFFAAFALPDLMYQLLVGGALSSAFIPVFTEYLAKDQKRKPGMWPVSFESYCFSPVGDYDLWCDFHPCSGTLGWCGVQR